MTALYPYLPDVLQARMLTDLERDWLRGNPPSTLSEDGRCLGREFASTGGTPVRDADLRHIRDEVLSAVAAGGSTEEARAAQRRSDRAVGRILLRLLGPEPSALFGSGTWAFFTMVLLPDLVLSRYGDSKNFPKDRFQDGRRNALATLYLRELLLPSSESSTDESDDDLLAEELVQLFDRSLVADRRLLKAMVARRQGGPEGVDRRTFFRELQREATFERTVTMLAVLEDEEMEELADQLVRRTVVRISGGEPFEEASQEAREEPVALAGSSDSRGAPPRAGESEDATANADPDSYSPITADTSPVPSVELPEPTPGDGPKIRDPQSTATHRKWQAPETGAISDLDQAPQDPVRAAKLSRLLVSVVAAEYPIRRDEAARQVIGSLGMKKVRATRIDAFWQVVGRDQVRLDERDFLWPASVSTAEFTGFRSKVLRHVGIDLLHPLELSNAMSLAIDRSRSADQETQMRYSLALLGGGRMTEGTRSALLRAHQDVTSVKPLRSASIPPAAARQGMDAAGEDARHCADQGTAMKAADGTDQALATGRRRGRPRIDPEAEIRSIAAQRNRGVEAMEANDCEAALADLETVCDLLTSRMTRLRRQGRDGDEAAAVEAARSQKLRGETFGVIVELCKRMGRIEQTGYFLGRAANDHHEPSMIKLAHQLEDDGRMDAASTWAALAAGLIPPTIDLPPEGED